MTGTINLLELNHAELTALLADWGQPRYRADQLRDWLYVKLAADADEMTNLPASLRARLAVETRINPLEQIYEQKSRDGRTIKWLFRLADGQTVETVLMLYPEIEGERGERRTVCISTQAGCAMGCVFCATGQTGLARNLTAGEIVAQVLTAARAAQGDRPGFAQPDRSAPHHLTNVVVMGMGEPLANYDRTWQALRVITDPDGFDLGAPHHRLHGSGWSPASGA